MPCLEISMPEIETDQKELLARKLTEAFTSATRFEAEIFGIRFFEYRHGDTASGGELWTGGDKRPYLHFLLYCPRLSQTERRKAVELFTSAFTEVLDKPSWKPVVHFCEHPYTNVGVEGALLSDSYKELAEKPFYYDTSDG